MSLRWIWQDYARVTQSSSSNCHMKYQPAICYTIHRYHPSNRLEVTAYPVISRLVITPIQTTEGIEPLSGYYSLLRWECRCCLLGHRKDGSSRRPQRWLPAMHSLKGLTGPYCRTTTWGHFKCWKSRIFSKIAILLNSFC